jgi:hypothetical protein
MASLWAIANHGILVVNASATGLRPAVIATPEFYRFDTRRLAPIPHPPSVVRWGVGSPILTLSRDGQWLLYVQYDQWNSDIHMLEGPW